MLRLPGGLPVSLSSMELDELNRRVKRLEDRVGMLEKRLSGLESHIRNRLREEADDREGYLTKGTWKSARRD